MAFVARVTSKLPSALQQIKINLIKNQFAFPDAMDSTSGTFLLDMNMMLAYRILVFTASTLGFAVLSLRLFFLLILFDFLNFASLQLIGNIYEEVGELKKFN